MLAILIIWFYIFLICLVFGFGLVKLGAAIYQEDGFERLPLSLLLILGLCLVSTIVSYFSLFIKIGFIANGIILLGALLLAGLYYGEIIFLLKSSVRRLFSINKWALALLIMSSFFILAKSAAPKWTYDTGLYYAQAIRWIEEYPVIPGLGNLHGRLAFNSTWFLPNALFGFSFLKLGRFHMLNGFLSLIILATGFNGLSNLIKRQYYFSNILKAGILLPVIFIYKDQLASPTPDIPVALLTCAVFIYYVQLQERGVEAPSHLLAWGIVLVSTFAIIIKLSALPLAIFIVVLMYRELAQGRPLNFAITTGTVLFLVLPFFLRNIWLSGYLLYPFSGLDLFHVDWKIPKAAVLIDKRAILEFARDPKYLAPPGAVKTYLAWVPYWFPQVITDYGGKLRDIFLPSLVLLVDWLGHMLKMGTCKIEWREIGNHKVVYLTAAAGLLFWFLAAPDPRFVLGLMMVLAIIIFIPFLKSYDYHLSPLVPWSLLLLILYFLVAFRAGVFPPRAARLWQPAPYPQARLVIKEMEGHKVYFPRDSEGGCWYAPLPCAYAENFAFRGDRLEDGFKPRSKPLTGKKKQ